MIELLVVLVITGLLAGIAVWKIYQITRDSLRQTTEAQIAAIETARLSLTQLAYNNQTTAPFPSPAIGEPVLGITTKVVLSENAASAPENIELWFRRYLTGLQGTGPAGLSHCTVFDHLRKVGLTAKITGGVIDGWRGIPLTFSGDLTQPLVLTYTHGVGWSVTD